MIHFWNNKKIKKRKKKFPFKKGSNKSTPELIAM
jgi:hypothetical protein